jgi:hypothetical protein
MGSEIEKRKLFLKEICELNLFAKYGNMGTPKNLAFYLDNLFESINIKRLNILDIGAGIGVFSIYLSIMGASKICSLEPELDGGHSSMNQKFEDLKRKLEIRNVSLLKQSFQDLDENCGPFDLILMHNSVNHLDEGACMHLKHDNCARDLYLGFFTKIHGLTSKNGSVIIADCSRNNFWDTVGAKNPFAPTIEWKKHQSPYFWRSLLEEVGFSYRSLCWTTISIFGKVGKKLMSNLPAAYFLNSHFKLVMKKTD